MLLISRSPRNSRILILLLLLTGVPALAEPGCPIDDVTVGDLHVYSYSLSDEKCNVTVTPAWNDHGLTYRDYTFGRDGSLMVFNSVPGDDATSTGARSYFLFPRSDDLSVSIIQADGGQVRVRTPSGVVFIFSAKTDRIQSISGASWSEDPRVSMSNQGGVEIRSIPGVLLDTGWKLGDISYSNPRRLSVFRDSAGDGCQVANGEIFSYSTPDPHVKYATDASLWAFLAGSCPGLSP